MTKLSLIKCILSISRKGVSASVLQLIFSQICMLTGIQVMPYYALMLYRTPVIARWSYIRKPSAAPLRWDACQGPHLLLAG